MRKGDEILEKEKINGYSELRQKAKQIPEFIFFCRIGY